MHSMGKRTGGFAWALLLALVVIVAIAPAAAQVNATLRGTVTGESGPLPGATIVAKNVVTGFEFTTVTSADGSYVLSLPAATYDVSVKMETFRQLNRRLQVLVGQNLAVNFKMQADNVLVEDMTVVGNRVLENRAQGVVTNVTTEQIEYLPQGEKNFLNFAALAPGVRVTDDEKASQGFSSTGMQGRQVNVFIDGQSFKNDLIKGGAFMQDSSKGNPFPQSAVQEFRVLTQNYQAEYEKSAAAIITAVTKSGGNQYHGGIELFYQGAGMVGLDPKSEERGLTNPDYSRYQGALTFSGPIIKDKLNFFASYERNEQDDYKQVYYGSRADQIPENLESVFAPYETGNVLAPFRSNLFFGKVSWQPSVGHTIDFTASIRDESNRSGFGALRVYEGAENLKIGTNAFTVRDQWVIGSNWLNEASVTYQDQSWNPTAIDESLPHRNYRDILDIGGRDYEQDLSQERIGIRDDLTFTAGNHVVKGGITAYQTDYKLLKLAYQNPYYEYRVDEDWQYPFLARIGAGDPGLQFDNTVFGIYLQDNWRITPNIEIAAGLRWDYESNMLNNDYVTPPEVVDALYAAERTVDGTTYRLQDVIDLNRYTTDGSRRDAYMGMIQPRIGVTWDIKGDGKTVVFGGWGRYYDRVGLNDIFDESYRHTWSQYTLCFSAPGQEPTGPVPGCGSTPIEWNDSYDTAEGLRNLVASGSTPGIELFMVDNEMKPPKSDQWTAGVRQTFGNWLFSLSYSNVRGENGMAWFFGDLLPGTTDRWGGNIPIPGYARMFITDNSRQWWYDGYFLTIDKPFSNNWGFNLAYTYASSESTGPANADEGTTFSAFDYLGPEDYEKHPGDNDERNRLVVSGIVGLPWEMRLSGILTLGSGLPFTNFGSPTGWSIGWNEGRPEGESFLGVGEWVYRSLDLRLQKVFTFGKSNAVTLTLEGFNVLDWENYRAFDGGIWTLPAVNPNYGKPNEAYNPRRYQVGASYTF